MCGSISEYDDKWAGQTQWNMILMRRLTVSGFICMDHMNEFGEATTELSRLVKEGRIKYGTLTPPNFITVSQYLIHLFRYGTLSPPNTFIRNGLMRSTGTPKTFA